MFKKRKLKNSASLESNGDVAVKSEKLCYCICLAEFDLKQGNVLSVKYPDDAKINTENFADLCFVDGSHAFDSSLHYFFTKTLDNELMYATVFFRNKKDPDAPRGAIQKSLCILSGKPMLRVWEPILDFAMSKIMADPDRIGDFVYDLHTALADGMVNKELAVKIWNRKFPIKIPKDVPDRFSGVSALKKLVLLFKVDTMVIWHAMINQKRIFMVGSPARSVADFVLTTPLLVSPLFGYTPFMNPYVSLNESSNFEMQSMYIYGTTNPLFEMKNDWWDICGSMIQGRILQNSPKVKLSNNDKSFIRSVVGGIVEDDRPEKWVCDQFESYTKKFLAKLAKSKKKNAIIKSDIIQSYFQRKEENVDEKNLDQYLSLVTKTETSVIERVKNIFGLSKLLEDLTNVDDFCDGNGIEIVTLLLEDENSQIRKFALKILSQIVMSVKGQYEVSSNINCMGMIIKLLDDKMPNVRKESCYCIMKLSNSTEGRSVVLSYDNIIDKLVNFISSDMSDLKVFTCSALLNICQNESITQPDPAPFKNLLSTTADLKLRYVLLKLMDCWNEDLSNQVPENKNIQSLIKRLSTSTILEVQIELSRQIKNLARQDTIPTLQFVEHGILKVVIENANQFDDATLQEISTDLLLLFSTTNYGIKKIIETDQMIHWINTVKEGRNDLHTIGILSIFQRIFLYDVETISHFIDCKGHEVLYELILKFHQSPDMVQITCKACEVYRDIFLKIQQIKEKDSILFLMKKEIEGLAFLLEHCIPDVLEVLSCTLALLPPKPEPKHSNE